MNDVSLQLYFQARQGEIDSLRQNSLMNESSLISFARARGVPVDGVVVGEPGDFHRRGWLRSDSEDEDGAPRFHPFRLYILHKILERRRAFGTLLCDPPGIETIHECAYGWNNIVDLATMLEPLYWPEIVGSMRIGLGRQEDFRARLDRYRSEILGFLKTLDSNVWREIHNRLLTEAAFVDANGKLYALLRLSNWDERRDLAGAIGGALWIRHMAEVLRRGFEDALDEQWPQEYEGRGLWHAAARKRAFGSERPFDEPLRSKPYLARTFGLFTGSSVRWYVEGETEYYAVLEILREPFLTAVELVNLRGNVKSERDNAALKLEDWLKEDQSQRRFSMITFDRDEGPTSANVKAIARQVQNDNVVGLIAAHKPDFEFANFTTNELAEIAAKIDETHGYDGTPIRVADWTSVTNAGAFERRYLSISSRRPGKLKDEQWGRALANYAIEHPRKADGSERPLWSQVRGALHGWMSNYDAQRERFRFDPLTFASIPR